MVVKRVSRAASTVNTIGTDFKTIKGKINISLSQEIASCKRELSSELMSYNYKICKIIPH
jgi:hypothetical protein